MATSKTIASRQVLQAADAAMDRRTNRGGNSSTLRIGNFAKDSTDRSRAFAASKHAGANRDNART